jgi:hypothetical protein
MSCVRHGAPAIPSNTFVEGYPHSRNGRLQGGVGASMGRRALGGARRLDFSISVRVARLHAKRHCKAVVMISIRAEDQASSIIANR